MQSYHNYLFAFAARVLSACLLLTVPSEFWVQVLAVLDVPDQIKTIAASVLGAVCSTGGEVIKNAIEQDKLVKEGKLTTDYHDPTAKFWPLKILIGTVVGILGSSLFSPAVLAIIPKASEWSVSLVAGASGYWFISRKLPAMLNKNENDKDNA